jgi:serine/threonine protein kinase
MREELCIETLSLRTSLLEQGKDMNQIKVIDFGISVICSKDTFLVDSMGTPYYIAPEVWNKKYN